VETNVVHKSDWLLAIEGKVAPAEVSEEKAALTRKFAKKAKLSGFRPGKAPLEMVASRFEEDIRTELVEEFASKAYRQALADATLKPLTQGRITHWNFIQDDELRFEVEVEVIPALDVRGYNELRLEAVTPPAKEELVERRLEALRERAARLEPVEREAKEGDFIRCDYSTQKAGAKEEKHTNILILLGDKENLPDINGALQGKKAQDSVEVTVNVPASEGESGETQAVFKFKIHEVKEKKLPELDDNFAKDMGHENLTAFREKLAEDAELEARNIVREKEEDQIFKQLLEKNPFDPPPSLVDEQIHYLMRRLRLEDSPEIHKELEPRAQDHVRLDLIFEALAEKERITVSDEELERWYEERSQGLGIPLAQAKSLWKKDRAREEAIRRKTIDSLLERAAQGGLLVHPDSH
jgi:trigger factor